jgi:hypothetical protein
MQIRINITDDQGTLLGQLELDADEVQAARTSGAGAMAIVDDIATEAGIRPQPEDDAPVGLSLAELAARARNSSLTDPSWRTDYRTGR